MAELLTILNTSISAITITAGTDKLVVVSDPGGTPVLKNITVNNFLLDAAVNASTGVAVEPANKVALAQSGAVVSATPICREGNNFYDGATPNGTINFFGTVDYSDGAIMRIETLTGNGLGLRIEGPGNLGQGYTGELIMLGTEAEPDITFVDSEAYWNQYCGSSAGVTGSRFGRMSSHFITDLTETIIADSAAGTLNEVTYAQLMLRVIGNRIRMRYVGNITDVSDGTSTMVLTLHNQTIFSKVVLSGASRTWILDVEIVVLEMDGLNTVTLLCFGSFTTGPGVGATQEIFSLTSTAFDFTAARSLKLACTNASGCTNTIKAALGEWVPAQFIYDD